MAGGLEGKDEVLAFFLDGDEGKDATDGEAIDDLVAKDDVSMGL